MEAKTKPIYTTLNKIREYSPCTDGWEKLLKYLGKSKADDEPLAMAAGKKERKAQEQLFIKHFGGLDD